MADPAMLARRLEVVLEESLAHVTPPRLAEALRYAVLGPGKRLRPVLCLLAAEAVGGNADAAVGAAAGIELVHAYSLVHDDLPAMDNAPLRRGKPSCHAAFGEAEAILAGDVLLTLAFEVLVERTRPPELSARLVAELARASGWAGMAGGQWDDVRSGGDRIGEEGRGKGRGRETDTEYMDVARRKTAALIRCAVVCGGLCGGANAEQLDALGRFGGDLGMLFQLTDDLLDGDGAVLALGREATEQEADRLAGSAREEAARLGNGGEALAAFADRIRGRRN